MKLEQITEGQSALLHMERYVVEGSRSYTTFNQYFEIPEIYRPTSDFPSFNLQPLMVPRELLEIYQANPNSDLQRLYTVGEEVPFYVHPELLNNDHEVTDLRRFPRGEAIQVAPTSSTRTVLTLESNRGLPPHFLKLHLPRMISRFPRGLERSNVKYGLSICNELDNIGVDKFAYLPESIGLVYKATDQGVIVREVQPRPTPSAQRYLIPFFALYAKDIKNPQDQPLLVQLVERLGEQPKSLVVDNLITPLIEIWCNLAKKRGILHDSHGQNTMLEIDDQFKPTRIILRDFDPIIDPQVRIDKGLDNSFLEGMLGVGMYPMEQLYSAMYDYQVSNHLLDYLARTANQYFGTSVAEIEGLGREVFGQHFINANQYFPETMFYYLDRLYPDGKFRLYDTQQRPRWR